MPQSFPSSVHCINPDCPSPYPQPWGNKFCLSCGTPLLLNRRYVPLQKLGTGGFAVTYTVYDRKSRTERVLKVLVETSQKALQLFEQEAAVLGSLRHPGLPRVEPDSYFLVPVDYSNRRTLPCLVMEKINGQTLEDVLDRYPQGCPEALALELFNQAVEILGELHRRQIIHRDLKPANFMLREQSQQLVVIDFGGAKQLGVGKSRFQGSSTRLISPGYSPPEQITGGAVGPAADFYALGRTFIHLLTGRYPADLDDPVTGECRWRSRALVTPAFANLLDRMVSPVANRRPSSAAEIQRLLLRMSPLQTTTRKVVNSAVALRNSLWALPFVFLWKAIAFIIVFLYKAIFAIAHFLFRTIFLLMRTCFALLIHLAIACSDTFKGMVLGGFGAILGAAIGFWLAYWLPIGETISKELSLQLNLWMPDSQLSVSPVVLLFGLAGLGTAWGLTKAGCFDQRQRFWLAGVMGMLGYGLGWISLQAIAPAQAIAPDALAAFTAIAIACVTLGLGLPKPHILHAAGTAIATASLIACLVYLLPSPFVIEFLTLSTSLPTGNGWSEFWTSIVFFGFLGSTCAFFLGVSYYLLVPFLRFLGFR